MQNMPGMSTGHSTNNPTVVPADEVRHLPVQFGHGESMPAFELPPAPAARPYSRRNLWGA